MPISEAWRIAPIGIFLFLAGYFIWTVISGGNWGRIAVVASFCGAAAFGLYILKNWRLGVESFFVWIIVEDLVRKNTGNQLVIYFVKDVIILATLIGYFQSKRAETFHSRNRMVPWALLLLIAWAVLESFNPALDNVLVPILGLRMSFFYVPMAILGYAYVKDELSWKRFISLNMTLGVVMGLLGLAQAVFGLNFLNPESAWGLRLYQTRGVEAAYQVPRPNATFVDAGRFAQYMFVMMFIGWAGLFWEASSIGKRRRVLWVSLLWGVVLAGLFVSGQRAAICWTLCALPFITFIPLRDGLRRKMPLRSFWMSLVGAALAVIVILAFLIKASPERFSAAWNYYSTTLSPSSSEGELFTRPVQYWKDTVFAFNESGLFGHGTGTESLGLPYVYHMDLYEDFDSSLYRVEGGYASVLWEWGIVGLILWLLWTSAVVWGLARQSRLLKGTGWYAMGVCTTIYAAFLLFPWFYMGLNFYQQYVAQAYLWFMIGIVYRLPSLQAVTECETVVASPTMNYRMIAPCEVGGNPWTR